MERDEPGIAYFGAWTAPMLQGAEQVPTPVGELCGYCEEEVRPGQCGVIRSGVVEHYECQLRRVIGGINHQRGTCRCCGGSDEPDPEWATWREGALIAVAYYEGVRDASPSLTRHYQPSEDCPHAWVAGQDLCVLCGASYLDLHPDQ